MGDVILTMKGIDKSFPGVHALDHVNFRSKTRRSTCTYGRERCRKVHTDESSYRYLSERFRFHYSIKVKRSLFTILVKHRMLVL